MPPPPQDAVPRVGGSEPHGRESPGPGLWAPLRPARPRAPPPLAPGPSRRAPSGSPVLGRGPPLVEQAEQRAGGGRAADNGGMAHGEIFAVGSHGASAAAEPQPSRAVASGRRECRDEGRGAPVLPRGGRPSAGALWAPRWGSPRERRGGSSCNGQRCRAAGGALSRLPAAVAPAPPREQRTKGNGWADGRAPLRGREGAACPAPVFSLWHLGLAAPAARCAAVRPCEFPLSYTGKGSAK